MRDNKVLNFRWVLHVSFLTQIYKIHIPIINYALGLVKLQQWFVMIHVGLFVNSTHIF